MISLYKIITFTHNQLDVSKLSQYQVATNDKITVDQRLKKITSDLGISEIMYLSTCNRVAYIFITKSELTFDYIKLFLSQVNPQLEATELDAIEDFVSVYEGQEAINHVFEVACSVDSLVVGESEIFHQFRTAYNQSLEANLTGDNLRLLEKITVQVAKKIYSKTRINEKPLSIASLAGQSIIAANIDKNAKILLVGAGETNTLVGKFLSKNNYTHFEVFNRGEKNGAMLGKLLKCNHFALKELYKPNDFKVLVVCTSSTTPIITDELYSVLVNDNREKKIIIDLSVPANTDIKVSSLPNVEYISIDNLRKLAENNLKFRRQEVVLAKSIITDSIKEFEDIYSQRQVELALADLPKELQLIKTKIKESVFKERLKDLNENERVLIDDILNYMESKAIAIPMKLAKRSGIRKK
jgi:glutamyl-tRNA reductase